MAAVVIGGAYGDEGKGATVNALATPESIVVRFNGGAQAGHTVIHNGHRHVCSHIGAGVLKGAATYLSRFFVSHPMAFLVEWRSLETRGIKVPRVIVSPESPVTTVFDVMLNRAVERKRGSARHGSCGVGFGETLERCQHLAYRFTVTDLTHGDVRKWLTAVRDDWVPQRCAQLGVTTDDLPLWWREPATLQRQEQEFANFLALVDVEHDRFILEHLPRVIFEGAQGLLLDQDRGTFPHVTRSNTGLKNVVALTHDEPLDVIYVTRAYTTRHGAGPLPYELFKTPYPDVHDATNVAGPFQGRLRFSYLNLDDVSRAVRQDVDEYLPPGSQARMRVTCLDQLPDMARVISLGEVVACAKSFLPDMAAAACDCLPALV